MTRSAGPDRARTEVLIRGALDEDGFGTDATTACLDMGDRVCRARVLAGADGVLAGGTVMRWVFEAVDSQTRVDLLVADGDPLARGQVVADISGSARHVLAGERVALNFLQRLSGIATLTADFVKRVGETGVRILDTRKTTPLHRELERYAVRMGGGLNHRFNLADMVLVKENHIRVVGGLDKVVTALRRARIRLGVEVEVDSREGLECLLGTPVDRIMLDNFTPSQVEDAVSAIAAFRRTHPEFEPEIEVSGGVTLQNVRDYAIPGVDFISVGALTHSAPALDFSLEVEAS